MKATEIRQSLENLMADPRLVEMCELQRTGDEVLDVISLSENQHSDILAWMLDPKEGHGQGDEILRDLLISASTAVAAGNSRLHKNRATARFFAKWPPSRIRTTSFGTVFIARELGFNAKERVDLFVVDDQNKFVLLIENKAGATHSEIQLNLYHDNFKNAVATNPRLHKYDQIYVALDREFDSEDASVRPSQNTWLHLGYDWLKTSAMRALMHVSRGNTAARLVVSYCNRQTDWESPEDEKCLQLAASLYQSYPDAVKHLISSSRGRLEKDWLAQKKEPEPNLHFLLQNRSAVELLKEAQGMASVKAAVIAQLPSLPRENVTHKRAWLHVCPTGWEQFAGESGWPVFLSVRYSDATQSKYSLALCWNANSARNSVEAEDLRSRLIIVEPKFGTHNSSNWRRVVLQSAVLLPDLLKLVAKQDNRLRITST